MFLGVLSAYISLKIKLSFAELQGEFSLQNINLSNTRILIKFWGKTSLLEHWQLMIIGRERVIFFSGVATGLVLMLQ